MATAIVPTAGPQQPATLMTVIERLAANPNVDIDKLQRLRKMQEDRMNRLRASLGRPNNGL